MKYRLDFSRLARTAEEVLNDHHARELLALVGRKLAVKVEATLKLPEGHILDTLVVEDEAHLTGKEALLKHVLPKYPEAKLSSWDCW